MRRQLSLRGPQGRISYCQWRLATFVEKEAYRGYDVEGRPAPGEENLLTMVQIQTINGAMRSRSPYKAWRDTLHIPLPELDEIPPDLDLIHGSHKDVEKGLRALRRLIRRLTSYRGLTDTSTCKALHLLRPRFIPVSDSHVRRLLGVDPKAPYADRAVAVARGMRRLARAKGNRRTLARLEAYVASLELTAERGKHRDPSTLIPVSMSQLRILDIILWSEEALYGKQQHVTWQRVFRDEVGIDLVPEDGLGWWTRQLSRRAKDSTSADKTQNLHLIESTDPLI
jgi:hypothetical protein